MLNEINLKRKQKLLQNFSNKKQKKALAEIYFFKFIWKLLLNIKFRISLLPHWLIPHFPNPKERILVDISANKYIAGFN